MAHMNALFSRAMTKYSARHGVPDYERSEDHDGEWRAPICKAACRAQERFL